MTNRILISSALPYVSATKHLGNLAGSLLPADVHARHHRQKRREVLFICGTDEHGTPAEIAAGKARLDVRAFCDERHAEQAETYRRLGLSFDHFGRSSSSANHRLTQQIYRRLDEAGFIEERSVPQVWSPSDGRFLPDRYVLGRCPHCHGEDARGDQCEACGTLLDPVDLLDPRSALSGATNLETRDSRHLFLRQSALVEALDGWLGTREGWPPFALSLARSLVGPDLRDRCITRDLSWGVPVPREGFEGKVFYVWFDAPIAYLAGIQEWAGLSDARDWRDWLVEPEARGTTYVQFLAKDNVPFHAVNFPATLIGTGDPWKKVDVIKAFHWLLHRGGKFSTSAGRGIFLDRALELLPADLWRWWLVANAPETSDVDFDPARFAADVNKDLADQFGNLVQRTTAYVRKRHDGVVPADGHPGPGDETALVEAVDLARRVEKAHEAREFRRAAQGTRALWGVANAHLQAAAPWKLSGPDEAAAIRTSIGLVRLCAAVAWPIIPTLAEAALRRLGDPGTSQDGPAWHGDVEGFAVSDDLRGQRVQMGAPLVAKVSPDFAG